MLNEWRAGVIGKPPHKPDCMQTWDTYKRFGLPLVAGGLLDQPYEFTVYMEAVDTTSKMMEDLAERARTAK